MKTATLLFTYNRSYHTRQVITALKNNTVRPQKLFVFQDGLKEGADNKEWKEVNRQIKDIDWCDKEIIVSDVNKGLANSILSGINYAFEGYDAVIVLEDDCVPTINFISYMLQCFEKYNNDKRVYSVSGYAWPINVQKDSYDVYGCGRISSWGWGTWKDRWKIYEKDYEIVVKIQQDEKMSQNLALWGRDLEDTLVGNIRGYCNSWAVFWALNAILQEGICINPYKSLIQNIGMDGSGVHCGVTTQFEVEVNSEEKRIFNLPDQIEISDDIKKAFTPLFGNYTAINIKDKLRERILVYGLGNFFSQNEKDISEHCNIIAFIDRKKSGYYAGKKIIHPDDVAQYDFDKIIIMVQSIHECICIARLLLNMGVDAASIILGHSLFGEYSRRIDKILVLPDGRIQLFFGDTSIKVRSEDEFNNVCEVFVDQTYNYFINDKKQDIVLDVGMNVGDTVLYFADLDHVKQVYGFEPFRETFSAAEENLKDNVNQEKINVFQYGISNENATRILNFNEDMTCGQSTIADIREKAYGKYSDWGLTKPDHEHVEQIEVRKASEVFGPIIRKHPNCNIVLKMDCEGEEYGILDELLQSGILGKITFIMLEWHYKGKNSILQNLKEAGFSWWCNDKSAEMGLIYAYRL